MTSTAASLRTRRDTTAAVHPPTTGAHRLPPRALLHLINITFAVLREIITPIVQFLRSFVDIKLTEHKYLCPDCHTDGAPTLHDGFHRCSIVYGFCWTCGTVRHATRAGFCRNCTDRLTNYHIDKSSVWRDIEEMGRKAQAKGL